MAQEGIKATKRVCVICNKEFELSEYLIHLQEEQLNKLNKISKDMESVLEYTRLTYEFMGNDAEAEYEDERERQSNKDDEPSSVNDLNDSE